MALFNPEQLIDPIGACRTQSLFLETNKTANDPIMTLKEFDVEYKGSVLPSLKRLYMEAADPTEYRVAVNVFGSWKHWQALLGNKLILKRIETYRDELDIMIRSESVRALIETATSDGAKGTAAAKYIAEKGWDKRKAGAPSKLEKEREMKVNEGIDEETDKEMIRLGLVHSK